MKRLLLATTFLCLAVPAFAADTPNPVTPGYQICRVVGGATFCGFQPVDTSHPLPVTTSSPTGTQSVQGVAGGVGIGSSSQYPVSATGVPAVPITGNAAGSTGAVVGTLAAAAGKTTFICGFDVSYLGGTAAISPVTIAGLVGSSMVYQFPVAATGGQVFSRSFTPCIPASAANTAITITTTADGTASAVNVNSSGYQQ